MKHNQNSAPIFDALARYRDARVVPFDVPGHKHGKGNPELTAFLGKTCMDVDVNSMKPLDNLCHPVSVIREAESLAADAFGAAHCFFMVGGTTSAVQSMILASVRAGEKIIMPRNVHRSAINALILADAVPVYVNPGVNAALGIPLGMSAADVKSAIEKNPDAAAVFVNNPTYYGICPDIKSIAEIAHAAGMTLLADEAHGTQFYFSDKLPQSAMSAGADLSSVSMHKSGGSLTQSSFLLLSKNVSEGYVRSVINLTQTTSASYLLLSSLDISRRRLALSGGAVADKIIATAEYAREEIAKIGGFRVFDDKLINFRDVFDFDLTKLSVNTRGIGLAGIEVYDILRDRFDIQIEFGDIANILCYISDGDRWKDIERLVSALAEIKRRDGKAVSEQKGTLPLSEYIPPDVAMTPREAFFAKTARIALREAAGHISGEFVMCYPPGIPVLAPGERITKDIIDYIIYSKEKGSTLTGPQDIEIEYLNIVAGH
ncbi:MAG: aminotransferase class I/II-fold pyridoxal phosphate-dependent enzyme [Ruminococcus sp.]|jgi:arginine/lysine/ornithine decarboxylase|nr:aminotransferase class I/II-fold pyridoxal phosphate-dependent enzyme [Ruminococcus sp.]